MTLTRKVRLKRKVTLVKKKLKKKPYKKQNARAILVRKRDSSGRFT